MQKGMACFVFMALGMGIIPGMAADCGNGERLAQRWCAACRLTAYIARKKQ
jgi:hypothetical protein